LAAWPPRLRAVVDLVLDSPLPMAALWGEGLVPIYNDRFAARLGAQHPAALGRSPYAGGMASALVDLARCERVLSGEELNDLDATPAARGTPCYAPLRADDGGIAGVLLTAVGEATNPSPWGEREALLQLAMEAASAGAWAWDAHTNVATWDDRYHAMYGFARGEPRLHEAWLGRLHPDDRPAVVARLEAVRRTPGDDGWDMEFRAVTPDRGVVWMQGLGRAVRDAGGALVSMSGINLDISERKRVEQRLRESEEKLRLFFAYAPAAAAMFDREMRYLAVSRRWLQDFGLVGDIIGRCHYDVFPEIPERWKEILHRSLAGATERAEEDRFDRADGSTQWLRWEVLPWRTDVGEIGGLIILSEDITEARRWKESQQVLVGELQHRTRNLLAVVESIAQQTMRSADSVEAFMERFSVRLRALSRVQGLLSRSDREPITISALVRMELEALGPDAVSARTFVAGPEVRLRKRDVQTLALAIHELATNACKYGALATDRGRLSVTWRLEGGPGARQRLALEWVESGIEQRFGRIDARRGYGRTMIERALPYSLSAETAFELSEDAFRCAIRLPVDANGASDVAG
jgi:PAS domain S-box-containing protein